MKKFTELIKEINLFEAKELVYKEKDDNLTVTDKGGYLVIEQKSTITKEVKKIIIAKDKMLSQLIQFLEQFK